MDPAAYAAVFTVGGCISAWTLIVFVRDNRKAWLKITMLSWSVTSFVVALGAVFIRKRVPESGAYWTLLLNALAQLTAFNGIVDVLQFVYCSRRLLFLRETNASFAALYAALSAVTLLVCAAVLALHLTSTSVLAFYRCLSASIILIEASLYAYALIALQRNKRALGYYAAHLVSRIGLIIAVAGHICGFFDRRAFSIVHVIFVVVAVLSSALSLGRIRPGRLVLVSPTSLEQRIRSLRQQKALIKMRAHKGADAMRMSRISQRWSHGSRRRPSPPPQLRTSHSRGGLNLSPASGPPSLSPQLRASSSRGGLNLSTASSRRPPPPQLRTSRSRYGIDISPASSVPSPPPQLRTNRSPCSLTLSPARKLGGLVDDADATVHHGGDESFAGTEASRFSMLSDTAPGESNNSAFSFTTT